MYRYLDSARIQLWFDSPNLCAAFLDLTVLVSIGVFSLLIRHRERRGHTAAAVAAGLLILAQFLLIAQTYSRGGWLALGCALAGAAFWELQNGSSAFPDSPIYRPKTALLFLLLFLLCLLANPNGVSRIGSAADLREGSVHHRLLLWHGGLGVIAKHPLTGVPEGKIGKYYTTWYQPLWLDERYDAFVNDYLTMAGRYGLVLLFGYLSALLFILYGMLKWWRTTKHPLLLYTAAAMTGYMICGFFTTVFVHRSVYWLFIALAILSGSTVIWALVTKRLALHLKEAAFIGLPPILACLGIFAGGLLVNHRLPYRFEEENQVLFAAPRGIPSAKIIFVLSSDNPDLLTETRQVIRPLLMKHCAVAAFAIEPGLAGIAEWKDFLAGVENFCRGDIPVFILATEKVSNIVVCGKPAIPSLAGIIALNLPVDWPWDALSPVKHIRAIDRPILILQSEAHPYSPEDLHKLQAENGDIEIRKIQNGQSLPEAILGFISRPPPES